MKTAGINSYSVSAQDAAGDRGSMSGQFLLASAAPPVGSTLTGLTGVADVFAIMAFKGSEVIKGFEAASVTGATHDSVDLSGLGIHSYSQLHPMISGGASAMVTLGSGKTVTLSGVAGSALTAADFRFS